MPRPNICAKCGLGIGSIYDYLEYRFDPHVRRAASGLFLVWQLLWLSVIASAGCQAVAIAAEWRAAAWLLIIPMVGLAALIVFLGGLSAVVWAGVIELAVMSGGVAVVSAVVGQRPAGVALPYRQVRRELIAVEGAELARLHADGMVSDATRRRYAG